MNNIYALFPLRLFHINLASYNFSFPISSPIYFFSLIEPFNKAFAQYENLIKTSFLPVQWELLSSFRLIFEFFFILLKLLVFWETFRFSNFLIFLFFSLLKMKDLAVYLKYTAFFILWKKKKIFSHFKFTLFLDTSVLATIYDYYCY